MELQSESLMALTELGSERRESKVDHGTFVNKAITGSRRTKPLNVAKTTLNTSSFFRLIILFRPNESSLSKNLSSVGREDCVHKRLRQRLLIADLDNADWIASSGSGRILETNFP